MQGEPSERRGRRKPLPPPALERQEGRGGHAQGPPRPRPAFPDHSSGREAACRLSPSRTRAPPAWSFLLPRKGLNGGWSPGLGTRPAVSWASERLADGLEGSLLLTSARAPLPLQDRPVHVAFPRLPHPPPLLPSGKMRKLFSSHTVLGAGTVHLKIVKYSRQVTVHVGNVIVAAFQ